ncbi:uncharacterized protein Dwil_GK24477 [Drosophila willistoni]|uniref:BESS domain-containing protein n=1 Tax=Drosophila willistoni TaxID=7260 RepID=B4N0I0_DROWI|nr:probable E3 ubiquitin-protein ligase bre1 [Drosophila willistoni]EDW77593.1 uncharacterized protein Dwil_GK24477 [Drosophila willistoni]
MKLKHEKVSDSVPKVKRLYHQRYRKEWEDNPSFAPWLQASNHGFSAHCRACSVDILARLASIKQHQNTVKHQNGMKCNQVLLDQNDEARNALPDEHEEFISLESKEEEFATMKNSVKSEQIESIPPYKYRKDWEEIPNFSPWLQASNIDHLAHCKFCNVNMLARIGSIKQHETSAKHQKAVKYNKIYTNTISQIQEDEANLDVDHEEFLDCKTKPKTRAQSNPEQLYTVERVEYKDDNDNMSNDDSILDTLLSAEEMGTYSNEEDLVEIEDQNEEEQEQDQELDQQQDFYVQDVEMNVDELQEEQEKDDEENPVINEFDLFGKSVALQLNQMDLEDALLCQDRLQAVITNFRLRVLKRQKQSKIR